LFEIFYQSDLLADPNSNWSFEPKTGLKLKKAKIDDTGHFECTGTYKGQVYSRDIYLYVGGRSFLIFDKRLLRYYKHGIKFTE
jgi:hypothetical protein